ncbi:hypothetical protein D5S19_03625 [Amycolatopsis panacis]|uniref:Uncharacterized protein n=1 Tax=Amycolatopsis panacis TaxID=2340917 RepID=A0A419IA76_9PSEU|nr:hypothetical protein D5S19_03625 [Amycolatopsis panacis]
MDESWSDPAAVLNVVVRVRSVSRPRMLSQFSHGLPVLLPHREAVMQTRGCPHKTVGTRGLPMG